jgi:hypothetical protein
MKLNEMGTTGLIQWTVSDSPRRFGIRVCAATKIIKSRTNNHRALDAFKRACNAAYVKADWK